MKDLFLTTKEVAKILRVTSRTIQNYRSDGTLKYYKISPRIIRYKAEDVLVLLKKSHCSSIWKDRAEAILNEYMRKKSS